MLITAVQVTLILGVSAHGTLSLLLHGQAMAGATVLNGALPLQQPASRLTTPRQQVPSSSSLLVNLLAANGQLMALMVTLLMFNPFLATALRSAQGGMGFSSPTGPNTQTISGASSYVYIHR